jgi:ABC-type antimicrobial peptide transport system permease subunit
MSVPNLGMCRGNNDRWTVVGVVDDMRQGAEPDVPQAELFQPARQIGCTAALSQAILVVRTSGDPLPYTATLRSAVREQEPTFALDSVMTMEDRVMTALAKPRLYAVLLTGFAFFAVAIAAVGLFSVLSYSVGQRSREIGLRTALGAQASDIVGLVLRQAAVVAAVGIGTGVLAAFALSRSLTAVLHGINSLDATSFAIVAVALTVVAGLACLVPARRAARIDPAVALRCE